MWGKLTERKDGTRIKIITEPHELYRFLATPAVEVTNLVYDSVNVVWLSWKLSVEEYVLNVRNTNEVIGAYVTAGARIHLYGFLDRLQENAMYCDRDSIIFIQPSAEPWPIATRGKLWDMQYGLKPSEYIAEFSLGGPKI